MDDDQNFVTDVTAFVENHESVDYLQGVIASPSDEGRNVTLDFTLFTGDRYQITITELHD